MNNYTIEDIIISDASSALVLHNSLCFLHSKFSQLELNRESFLHPKELAVYQELKHPRRQNSYLQGRYAAKLALIQRHNGIKANHIFIDTGVFGFPFIATPNEVTSQLSISHSGDMAVAIAYAQSHPMAIDIEQIANRRSRAIKSKMLPEELSMIDAESITDLTGLWTAKEALSKVLLCGLEINFRLLAIKTIKSTDLGQEISFKNFPQYKCITFKKSDCMVSLLFPANSALSFNN